LVVVTTLIALLAVIAGAATGAAAPEYQVKAAFLYNFARYVEWPEPMRAQPVFRICVVGDDPFGAALPAAVRDKTVQDRPVEVAHRDGHDVTGCHLAFVAASEGSETPRLLTGIAAHGVLTVGETEGFVRAGGVIGFKIEGNKVRFDVNADAANRAGLRISSQLLKLAAQVIQ
jgi:hypothetical protein